jgi:hypothetical protein
MFYVSFEVRRHFTSNAVKGLGVLRDIRMQVAHDGGMLPASRKCPSISTTPRPRNHRLR